MLLKFVLASFVLLSSIRDGSAGMTSSFVRTKWPSEDMPVDHEVFAIPKGYNAPQQVSLSKITRPIFLIYKLMRILIWTCEAVSNSKAIPFIQ